LPWFGKITLTSEKKLKKIYANNSVATATFLLFSSQSKPRLPSRQSAAITVKAAWAM